MKWKGNITVGLGSGWLLGVGSSLRFLNQRGLSLSLSLHRFVFWISAARRLALPPPQPLARRNQPPEAPDSSGSEGRRRFRSSTRR